jgi:hypothetical protein
MRIKDMHRDLLRVLNEQVAALETFHARLHAIEAGLAEWRPQVHLTDEQVAQIIDKLSNPLSIPAHAAEQVAEMAKHGQFQKLDHIGFGSAPLMVEWIFRPNGEIDLRLMDIQGAPIWRGTFRGPDA